MFYRHWEFYIGLFRLIPREKRVSGISEEECKSLFLRFFLASPRPRHSDTWYIASNVAWRKCIFVSAVSIRFDYINWASRRISARRRGVGSRVSFLSITWKIWRGSRRRGREGLFEKARRGGERRGGGKTDKMARYSTSAKTEKSKLGLDSDILYLSLPVLSLVLARKSIFVTADWARLDSRGWNESEMNEGLVGENDERERRERVERRKEKVREKERERGACKRRRWSMPTCVSKNHNFYL